MGLISPHCVSSILTPATMHSELVEYIIDDCKKWCIDKYDLWQNMEFWMKYGWLTDQDKKDLSQFYSMWSCYIEVYGGM